MININCYSCNKEFSFHQTEEGKSFCCPNCGKYSLVSLKINNISLPEVLNQSDKKLAIFLTPMELYKIKNDNHKVIFRRVQFSSIAIVLLAISYFLILNKSEQFTQPATSLETKRIPASLSTASSPTSSNLILPKEKTQRTLTLKTNLQIINDNNQIMNSDKTESAPIGLNNRNMPNKNSDPNLNTVIEKAESEKSVITMENNKELNSIEVTPKPILNKPEFLEINVINFTIKKLFIKHKSATNIFLVSLEDYPIYIDGEDYFLEPLTELFIKVKSEDENNFSLIYFGEKKGHEFRLNNENLKIILKLGKQKNEDTLEYSLMIKETSTVSGVLHIISNPKNIMEIIEEPNKNEIIKEKPAQKDEREVSVERKEREVTKVVKVYNIPSQVQVVYKSYCSDCENYYTDLHTCNSHYINSFPNSNRQININHSSRNLYYNDISHSHLDNNSHYYSHRIKPVYLHKSHFNIFTFRVVKR